MLFLKLKVSAGNRKRNGNFRNTYPAKPSVIQILLLGTVLYLPEVDVCHACLLAGIILSGGSG